MKRAPPRRLTFQIMAKNHHVNISIISLRRTGSVLRKEMKYVISHNLFYNPSKQVKPSTRIFHQNEVNLMVRELLKVIWCFYMAE